MNQLRQKVRSGAVWENIVGYSRGVRVGNLIEVAGTTAIGTSGDIIGIGDPHRQTIHALTIIKQAIEDLGGSLQDVVRTRLYVVDIQRDWEAIGAAHGLFFAEIQPVTTMVEVKALIRPELLVEVEATAVVVPLDRAAE